jgi:hypothetical protein
MLLFGGNTTGDYKIRPLLVYCAENSLALRIILRRIFLLCGGLNTKAWITASLFESYFASDLCHELKAYFKRVKVLFKILLFLDNAAGHLHAFLQTFV